MAMQRRRIRNPMLHPPLSECLRLAASFCLLKITLCYREANKVADTLAHAAALQ
ncbi:hypothetical protein COLO4_06047 [Corchorus olitorius]|uniref:RNase H type-1 domain-containing protein n=1 Tax=Corchorus olitorius TaxID=93759 RepID=A0A1R3KP37_9ROSI|nr:hypothetical protein COLO4_06047 [Corchorus olitorius]